MNKISGASEDVGTLYFDSSELEKDDYVSRTKIGTLKFIPEEPGTYEVDFSIFEDEDAETVLASGTLTIPNSDSFGRRADVPIHKGLVAVGLMRMSALFSCAALQRPFPPQPLFPKYGIFHGGRAAPGKRTVTDSVIGVGFVVQERLKLPSVRASG